ncbi:hypothetical protein Tco_1016969 [Tanacetum coccineum]|uniref:Reverse transcriptase domain-containing protein n=1 Tax=Tanacetum coccineum TaxID=301880 RepID=A0ABQ5FQN7_9ASTR
MRQRRWLELLSDYNCEIRYHPGKANVNPEESQYKDVGEELVAHVYGADLRTVVHDASLNQNTSIIPGSDKMVNGSEHQRLIWFVGTTRRFPNGSGINIIMDCITKPPRHSQMAMNHLDQATEFQAACDRQKSYADLKRKLMEFQVGDRVMLKVSPWKGVVHFGKRGKLNPRYVGPLVLGNRLVRCYKLEPSP